MTSIIKSLTAAPISKTVFPPHEEAVVPNDTKTSVFLAGSIEMGNAENWQDRVTAAIENLPELRYIFNPRRVDFYKDAVQSINDPYFKGQVEWELNHIDKCDILFMYLDPNTKSPISLMELGYIASSGKAIVCCPEGFWRKGNVEIICARANIPLFTDLNAAVARLTTDINRISRDKVARYNTEHIHY